MTDSTSGAKHVPSSLARQTLLDRELTRPVTSIIHSRRSSQPEAISPQVSRLCSR